MKFSTVFTVVALAGVSSANAALRGVLPANMKELVKDKYATQSNRGVAITSDSFEDQLADATLLDLKLKSAKSDELAFYYNKISPWNIWDDCYADADPMSAKSELALYDEGASADEDFLGSGREVNVDIRFPEGTRVHVNRHSSRSGVAQICEVQNDGTKKMIKNSAPDGLGHCDYIHCEFHVVVPGHSDGCDCKITIQLGSGSWFFGAGALYKLRTSYCGCFHVTDIVEGEGTPSAIPKGRNEWPCKESPDHRDDGCLYAPQMKLVVEPNN